MTAHDPQLRALLCTSCGAPLAVPREGGAVTCTYCRTTAQIDRFHLDPVRLSSLGPGPALDPEARERARLTSLRAQADTYDASTNLYAFYEAPPGLEHFDAILDDEPTKPHLLHEAFVEAIRHLAASRGALEYQRRVHWIARKLKQMHTVSQTEPDPQPYLETARELLTDPGFQQILRCDLASLARARGDLAAAEAWLESCDPRPGQLDLDSDYRSTASRLAIEREDWPRVLALCGESHEAIPMEPASVPMLTLHRIAALERLGRPADAEVELAWLTEHADYDFVRAWIDRRPHMAPVRDVWARRPPGGRSRAPEPPPPPRFDTPVGLQAVDEPEEQEDHEDPEDKAAAAARAATERRNWQLIGFSLILSLVSAAYAIYVLMRL